MTIQARINLRNSWQNLPGFLPGFADAPGSFCASNFLARLLQDGETLEDLLKLLLKLTPEQIFLRWVAAEQSFDTLLRT